MEIFIFIKRNIIAFWFSIFYVAFGGLVSCSMYPSDPLNGNWWLWGWIITFPVNIISSAFRYTGDIGYTGVIVIQCVIFIPVFLLLALILQRFKK